MRHFITSLMLSACVILGTSGVASAQYLYGYTSFRPYSGTIVTGQTSISPLGAAYTTSSYNPFTGYSSFSTGLWGNYAGYPYGYYNNPYQRGTYGYNTGYGYGAGDFNFGPVPYYQRGTYGYNTGYSTIPGPSY